MPNLSQFKNKDEYREWYRNYRKNNRKKLQKYNYIYNKQWRMDNGTEHDRVRSKVSAALKMGIIKKSMCEVCGIDGAQAHHEDYSKPLDVVWLCPVHHKERHTQMKLSLSTGK